LSAGLLDLVGKSNTNQSVVGLELLQCLWRVVDESEPGCLSTTELSLETENVDLVLVGLVEFGELASEFILGDVGTVWVEDITIRTPLELQTIHILILEGLADSMGDLHDHLLAAKERVADELARSQRDWLFTVRHVCEYEMVVDGGGRCRLRSCGKVLVVIQNALD
jgi:hypothetical protein